MKELETALMSGIPDASPNIKNIVLGKVQQYLTHCFVNGVPRETYFDKPRMKLFLLDNENIDLCVLSQAWLILEDIELKLSDQELDSIIDSEAKHT